MILDLRGVLRQQLWTWPKAGFLNINTIDIWGRKILCFVCVCVCAHAHGVGWAVVVAGDTLLCIVRCQQHLWSLCTRCQHTEDSMKNIEKNKKVENTCGPHYPVYQSLLHLSFRAHGWMAFPHLLEVRHSHVTCTGQWNASGSSCVTDG